MNYDEFKEAFIKSFEDYINENYSNYVINTESVLKNNITLDGLSLRREGDKIAPVVYLNYLHEDYISGKEIKDLVEHISQMMIDSITNKNDLKMIWLRMYLCLILHTTIAKIKSCLIFVIVN